MKFTSEMMKKVHRVAKEMEGHFYCRLSLAFHIVMKEEKMERTTLTLELAKEMCNRVLAKAGDYQKAMIEEFGRMGITDLKTIEIVDYLEAEFSREANDDNLDVKTYNLSDAIGVDVKTYEYKKGKKKEELHARLILRSNGEIEVTTRNCRVEFLQELKCIGVKTTEERFNSETSRAKNEAVKKIDIDKFPVVVELIGSEKQIAWAEKIRVEKITKLLRFTYGLDKYVAEKGKTEITTRISNRFSETLKNLSNEESSKVWIDNRNKNIISVGNYDESDILSLIERNYL